MLPKNREFTGRFTKIPGLPGEAADWDERKDQRVTKHMEKPGKKRETRSKGNVREWRTV